MRNNRVTNREAAILYKYFSFNEPCTRSINSFEKKGGKTFSLQVPTITHATDFLIKNGHNVSEETLSGFLDGVVAGY